MEGFPFENPPPPPTLWNFQFIFIYKFWLLRPPAPLEFPMTFHGVGNDTLWYVGLRQPGDDWTNITSGSLICTNQHGGYDEGMSSAGKSAIFGVFIVNWHSSSEFIFRIWVFVFFPPNSVCFITNRLGIWVFRRLGMLSSPPR